jgi:hypothetical protein
MLARPSFWASLSTRTWPSKADDQPLAVIATLFVVAHHFSVESHNSRLPPAATRLPAIFTPLVAAQPWQLN